MANRMTIKQLIVMFSILADKKDVYNQVQLFIENGISET